MRDSDRTQNSADSNPHQAAVDVAAPPLTTDAAGVGGRDVLRDIAEQVADCFAASGYAFVEEDEIDKLAAALRSFLAAAEIPLHPPVR